MIAFMVRWLTSTNTCCAGRPGPGDIYLSAQNRIIYETDAELCLLMGIKGFNQSCNHYNNKLLYIDIFLLSNLLCLLNRNDFFKINNIVPYKNPACVYNIKSSLKI